MTEIALETRHRYINESLARTTEWLRDAGVQRILGAHAVDSIESLMVRLYVPNIVRAGDVYVPLETPEEYRGGSSLPVMGGFPGDRFIPDGHMMRQTLQQREITTNQFAEMYDDAEYADRIVEGYDARLLRQAHNTKIFHVSRYDTDGSTPVAPRTFGPKQRKRTLFGRPFLLLTMGDMEEGFEVASPVTVIHELLHIDDYLNAGSVAITSLRRFIVGTELKSFHFGSRIERYAITQGITQPDEWADYNRIPGGLTYSERFEAVRMANADDKAPFVATEAVDNALVAEGLLQQK